MKPFMTDVSNFDDKQKGTLLLSLIPRREELTVLSIEQGQPGAVHLSVVSGIVHSIRDSVDEESDTKFLHMDVNGQSAPIIVTLESIVYITPARYWNWVSMRAQGVGVG